MAGPAGHDRLMRPGASRSQSGIVINADPKSRKVLTRSFSGLPDHNKGSSAGRPAEQSSIAVVLLSLFCFFSSSFSRFVKKIRPDEEAPIKDPVFEFGPVFQCCTVRDGVEATVMNRSGATK